MDFSTGCHATECAGTASSPTLFYVNKLLDVEDWNPHCLNYEDEPGLCTETGGLCNATQGLCTETQGLRAENADLKVANTELEIRVQYLQNEILMLTAMKEAAARTARRDPVVNFSIGGHSFVGKLSPDIHFARAGSQFAVYPPGSHPPAIAKLDLARPHFETLSSNNNGDGRAGGAGSAGAVTPRVIPFVGSFHSIAEVGRPKK